MAAPPAPLSQPTTRIFGSETFVVGAGVAIFHLASHRVVLCDEVHRGHHYHFLPKGRRDVGEESGRNAIREGFEESGFRNRLLPLPTAHLQPLPHPRPEVAPLTAEPVALQLQPSGRRGAQYVLYWYVAETLPPEDLEKLDEEVGPKVFGDPPKYPEGLTLRARAKMEPEGYMPKRTEGTGVDSMEALYQAALYPVDEAIRLLGEHDVQADVVRRGWNGIVKRYLAEGAENVD
jgi:hypothetical protein